MEQERSRAILLVPVDFAEASERALALAESLAGPLNADVVALHVHLPPVIAYPELPPTLVERIFEESEAAAQRSLAALSAKHPSARTMLKQGEPAEEILRVIAAERPLLVVMGTHGRRGLSRFILGSVAEHVVAKSAAPVMTTRADG